MVQLLAGAVLSLLTVLRAHKPNEAKPFVKMRSHMSSCGNSLQAASTEWMEDKLTEQTRVMFGGSLKRLEVSYGGILTF